MATELSETIDRLAQFAPVPFPVLSLYLNAQPDAVGRDRFEPFLRKTFSERLGTYRANGPERESLQRDIERIEGYLAHSLEPSAQRRGDLRRPRGPDELLPSPSKLAPAPSKGPTFL